jgi:predicted KAP-like P-loop ATPase
MQFWKQIRAAIGSALGSDPIVPDDTIGNAFAADTPKKYMAKEDLLGRESFVRALAKILYRHRGDDSLVIALRGEWGSGKTTIKNFVVEELLSAKNNPMRVVEFNPWQWGTDEAITRAFFREISAALGYKRLSLKRRGRAFEFRRYATMLERFSGSVKSAADHSVSIVGWLSFGMLSVGAGLITLNVTPAVLTGYLLALNGFIILVSKTIAWLGRDSDDARPLDFARARLEKELKTISRNILIVVDDIDRLEPDQIKLVIRHVKANANLPGLTYLLLFQKDIIERALDSGGARNGGEYLEKIVQAAFDVPVVEGARIERIVREEIQKLTTVLPQSYVEFDQVRWGNTWFGGVRHLIRNLRDARRFIGGLEVQFELHRGTRVMEANLIDVIAMEAIRVFEPDVFEKLAKNKSILTGSSERRDATKGKEALKALLSSASEENATAVQQALSQIFPMIGWAYDGMGYGPDWENKWTEEHRICSSRYFDRYFALRLPDGQISESEFLDLLDRTSDRTRLDEAFSDYRRRGLLSEVIDRLDDVKTKLPLRDADIILPALYDIAEDLPNSLGFSFSSPFISAWRTASWYIRCEPDLLTRGNMFLRSLRMSSGLAVPVTLIGLDIEKREKDRTDVGLILQDDQLEEAKRLWVERLRSQTADPVEMINNPHFISFMFRWKEYAGEQEPKQWVQEIATQPAILMRFIRAFCQERESAGIGDYVSRKAKVFDLNALLPFVDLVPFLELVRALTPTNPAEEEAKTGFTKAAEKAIAAPPVVPT